MNNQQKAYVYAIVAIFFWSTVATVFKFGLREIDVVQFLFFATWTSFLILFVINLIQGNLKKVRKLNTRDMVFAVLMGGLNPFVYYLILFKAYELLPAQVAQPLNMIWPIILVFLSVLLLGERLRIISIISLVICFTGVYFISSEGHPGSFYFREPLGITLALGSSFIWAGYWILNVKKGGDETFQLAINFFFAAIYISLLMIATNRFNGITPDGIMLAAYAGAFEMGFTFLFWIKAMKLTASNDRISNLVYIAPFLSLIFIHFLLGEKIFVTSVMGLTLIVLGIFLGKIRLS